MRMTFKSFLLMIALLSVACTAPAQTKIFEKIYTRTDDAPEQIVDTFTVPNPDGEFILIVQSGERERRFYTDAVIELNGKQVVGPEALSMQNGAANKNVTLQAENKIAITFQKRLRTSLAVSILGPVQHAGSPVPGVTVFPDAFQINRQTPVTFTAAISYTPEGPTPSVHLERVTKDGVLIVNEGTMLDNGQLSLGDEILGDGIFSFRKTYTLSEPEHIHLRIRADNNGRIAYSDIFSIMAFTPMPEADANAINEILSAGRKRYYERLPIKGHKQAAIDTVTFIKRSSLVHEAEILESDNSIWITFTNGVTGGILLHESGTRGIPARSINK